MRGINLPEVVQMALPSNENKWMYNMRKEVFVTKSWEGGIHQTYANTS